MKFYYALAASAALVATPALAQMETTNSTSATTGVQSTAETTQDTGVTVGTGTRINGGIRTGSNTSSTNIDTTANTSANTSATAAGDDADMATDTRITATGRGSTYEGAENRENRNKGQGKKLGHEKQENRDR